LADVSRGDDGDLVSRRLVLDRDSIRSADLGGIQSERGPRWW